MGSEGSTYEQMKVVTIKIAKVILKRTVNIIDAVYDKRFGLIIK